MFLCCGYEDEIDDDGCRLYEKWKSEATAIAAAYEHVVQQLQAEACLLSFPSLIVIVIVRVFV